MIALNVKGEKRFGRNFEARTEPLDCCCSSAALCLFSHHNWTSFYARSSEHSRRFPIADFYEFFIIVNSMHHQNRKWTCDGPVGKHNRGPLKSRSLYGRSIDLISALSWFRHQKVQFPESLLLYARLTAIKLFSLSSLNGMKWKRNKS